MRAKALVGALFVGIVGVGALAYAGLLDQSHLKIQGRRLADIYMPTVLTEAKERALKAGETFQECASCPVMVVVPAGEFMMGSDDVLIEKPRHKVMIAEPFSVGRFEVTFDEWDACVAHGACGYLPASGEGWGRGRQPVINVSWDDTRDYLAWLSKQSGKTYRLLSEAEWEYAVRATTTTHYSFGHEDAKLKEHGWYSENSNSRPHLVGEKKPNGFGIHDMYGNVWEWCEDNWLPNYQGAPNDGSAWQGGDAFTRVMRGGSWVNDPRLVSSAIRSGLRPDVRSDNTGFRIARTLSPPTP